MTAAIFSAAILTTLAALVIRRWLAKRRLAALQSTPGRSLKTPLEIGRYDEMDDLVKTSRCDCGGRLSRISEAGTSASGRVVRVLHTECLLCEAEHDFFFDLSKMLH